MKPVKAENSSAGEGRLCSFQLDFINSRSMVFSRRLKVQCLDPPHKGEAPAFSTNTPRTRVAVHVLQDLVPVNHLFTQTDDGGQKIGTPVRKEHAVQACKTEAAETTHTLTHTQEMKMYTTKTQTEMYTHEPAGAEDVPNTKTHEHTSTQTQTPARTHTHALTHSQALICALRHTTKPTQGCKRTHSQGLIYTLRHKKPTHGCK